MTQHHTVAALIHAVGWAHPADRITIAPGVSLCQFSGTTIERLYSHLCYRNGIDDGEPFGYQAFVLLEPTEEKQYFLDFGNPFSCVDRLCNLVAVTTSRPVGACRVIWTTDDFDSCEGTHTVFSLAGQTEFLDGDAWPELTDRTVEKIRHAWQTCQDCWNRDNTKGRITNALVFFYYAWRSYYLDQTCINLAIALETLFAPHEHSETTHQISFNVARFLSSDPVAREQYYRLIKKFYNARSSIVHGGVPDDQKYLDVTVRVFGITAEILARILLDGQLANRFNDRELRRELLREYMFE